MAEIRVHEADCVAWLRAYDGPLFDSVVTDPPYEIGFMGRDWDRSGVAFQPDTWRAVFERMKPGAHLAAFGGTRTYHRMAVAIEDAGFEIRDQLAWTYGSGFPKSLDVSKAIDAAAGAEREVIGAGAHAAKRNKTPRAPEPGGAARIAADHRNVTAPATAEAQQWQGWGTALKPAWEPICLARKPLAESTVAGNVLAHGTGGMNVDGCRIEAAADYHELDVTQGGDHFSIGSDGKTRGGKFTPAAGRFPANLLHDGSAEVLVGFPDQASGGYPPEGGQRSHGVATGKPNERGAALFGGSSGSAARFFYSAKAGPLDRIGSAHATVKPVDLMRWLVRLLTPPAGLVLEPFGGSGTTGIACLAEGFDCDLVELLSDHVADIRRKLDHLNGSGRRTLRDHLKASKAKAVDDPDHALPLFGAPSA